MAIAGHIDVRETVVVVVADGYAKEKRAVGVNFALRGYVGKCAIAIIAIESWLRRLRGMEEGRKAAVDENRVEVAVLVVVDPADPGAHRFRVHALGRLSTLVVKVDARLGCYIVKLHSEGICKVWAMAEGLSLRLLLLLAGAQGVANQARREIAGSKKQHRYG